MRVFNETDNLSEIKVGDRIEMEDGTVHEAISDTENAPDECRGCTMYDLHNDICDKAKCVTNRIHFKKVEP